jgi:hypothetical protein
MVDTGEVDALSLRTRADIATGVTAGLLLSTGTLIGAALVSPGMVLDALIVLILTFGVYRRSPICAAMLCGYWTVNFATTLLPDIHANIALLPVSVGILVLFALGLRGCFVERQIWRRQKNRLSQH